MTESATSPTVSSSCDLNRFNHYFRYLRFPLRLLIIASVAIGTTAPHHLKSFLAQAIIAHSALVHCKRGKMLEASCVPCDTRSLRWAQAQALMDKASFKGQPEREAGLAVVMRWPGGCFKHYCVKMSTYCQAIGNPTRPCIHCCQWQSFQWKPNGPYPRS